MMLKKIEIYFLEIPFKSKFSHSLKSRDKAQNLVIKLHSNSNFGLGESLPRKYVTNETILGDFKILENKIIPYFKDKNYKKFEEVIEDIINFLNHLNEDEYSAFCAFETALINLIAKEFNIKLIDIITYLNISIIKKTKIYYSAVIGTEKILKFMFLILYARLLNFRDIKLKISPNISEFKYKFTNFILKNKNLRVDANESLTKNNYIKIINLLKKYNFQILEQPLKPNSNLKDILYLYSKNNNIKILLDESFISKHDIKLFVEKKEANIADIRISKNGGIINSLLLYDDLKNKNNVDVILGCLVGETILSKFNIALGKYLNSVANEGLYDHFLFSKKNQIINNPKFGGGGVLKDLSTDIDFNDDLNSNFENFIKKRKIFTF